MSEVSALRAWGFEFAACGGPRVGVCNFVKELAQIQLEKLLVFHTLTVGVQGCSCTGFTKHQKIQTLNCACFDIGGVEVSLYRISAGWGSRGEMYTCKAASKCRHVATETTDKSICSALQCPRA